MLCTKCGKEFETAGNRCPDCGTVYASAPAFRTSEIGRFPNSNPGTELIGHQLVRKSEKKSVTVPQVIAVALAGCALCGVIALLLEIF